MKLSFHIILNTNDKTEKDVLKERENIVEQIIHKYGQNILVNSPYLGDEFHKDESMLAFKNCLWAMFGQDIIVFGKGYQNSKGCVLLHKICKEYGYQTMEM